MVNKNYQTLDLGLLHHCTDPKFESLVAGSSKVEEPELGCIPGCCLPEVDNHSPKSHLDSQSLV